MNSQQQLEISPFQSDILDLSRWLAAFLVVIEHIRSLMFENYAKGGRKDCLTDAFYFVTGFGYEAVMVFFVMSGFLVGGKVLERYAAGTFSWKKYAVDRGSRLYAVYVLALVLGGALDFFGYNYFNRFGLYDNSFAGRIAVVNFNFHENLTWPIFALNLGMCQTILGPVFGSNGSLWSLANESWYYLLGPLLFAVLFRKGSWLIAINMLVLSAVIWFLPKIILIYSLGWFMGAALYFINRRRILPPWCALLLFLACFVLLRLQWLKVQIVADLLIAISFSLLINSGACIERRLRGHVLSRKLADFSYSVYLCHLPFVVFILSVLYQARGNGIQMPPTALVFGGFLCTLLLTYLWCHAISLVTERQTIRIRKWICQWL